MVGLPAPERSPDDTVDRPRPDAGTLAWFGTAYGRRLAREKPSLLPANPPPQTTSGSLTAALNTGKPEQPPKGRKRRAAPFILLFAVLSALLMLRLMPLAPLPALDPVRDPSPTEVAPVIEASRDTAPDVPLPPIDGGEVTHAVPEPAEIPVAPSQETEKSSVQAPASLEETPSADRDMTPAASLATALPPLVPLEAATAPVAEARIVANPALAPIARPETVAVIEGRLPAPLPTAIVKTNLPKSGASPAPSPAKPGKPSSNPELERGQDFFARGDLLAARTAFAKAFELGLPEAALALGNTFDPVSLAKAGLKDKGDPMRARRWYRRAFERAMRRPGGQRP